MRDNDEDRKQGEEKEQEITGLRDAAFNDGSGMWEGFYLYACVCGIEMRKWFCNALPSTARIVMKCVLQHLILTQTPTQTQAHHCT